MLGFMEALRNPWVRFLGATVAGFLVAAGLGAWFQPHYLPLCNRINAEPGVDCSPISTQSMVGIFVIALGVITLILVPIVTAVIHLIRHGHAWETPRGTETAITNLPILAGVIYLASGTFVAIGGY